VEIFKLALHCDPALRSIVGEVDSFVQSYSSSSVVHMIGGNILINAKNVNTVLGAVSMSLPKGFYTIDRFVTDGGLPPPRSWGLNQKLQKLNGVIDAYMCA
jgi:hypothetical protein